MNLIFFGIFAYLCGSIPFGLVVSKLVKGIDIREHGSHNIGATNAVRTMGKKLGVIVFLLDGLKALVPLILARFIFGNSEFALAFVAFMVVIGHIFPVWLRFKGGKGITCVIFSLLVLDYKLFLLFLIVWIVMFKLFKVSALSALTAMIITTIASLFVSIYYCILMLLLSALIFYTHRENIERILNGKELKFNNKK